MGSNSYNRPPHPPPPPHPDMYNRSYHGGDHHHR